MAYGWLFLRFHPASLMDGQLVACSGTSTNPSLLYGLLPTIAIYFLPLFAVVPFSIEYNFTPSLGMDIPSEPIMMLLFGIGLFFVFSKAFHGNFSNYRHPITAILLLHFVWILISSINSQFQLFLPR